MLPKMQGGQASSPPWARTLDTVVEPLWTTLGTTRGFGFRTGRKRLTEVVASGEECPP